MSKTNSTETTTSQTSEVATATQNQGQTSSSQSKTDDGKKKKRKKHTIPLLGKCLAEILKIFSYQIAKSNEVKLQCMQKVFEGVSDVEKLWGQFMAEVNKLLDSRKYHAECETLNVNPENLAEHIVVLGRATVNRVLDNGILATIGTDYLLYKDRFTRPEDVDIYLPFYYEGPRKRPEMVKSTPVKKVEKQS